MTRKVRLSVDAELRRATERDLPALSTWSGHVKGTFAPAVASDDRVLLVANANGRFPIGHLLVDLTGGVLSHLLVLGGFRDQGLGTALIVEGERVLRERGVMHATLVVEKANDGAIRLYERLGYTREGETDEVFDEPMPDGSVQPVGHPSWVMRKEL